MQQDGKVFPRLRSFFIHQLYDLTILLTILVALPYLLVKIAASRKFRSGLLQRMGFIPGRSSSERMLWIHGVSVGEVKTIQPLLRRLEVEFGPLACAISSTTPAGYQIARQIFPERYVFYFPLDISFIVRRVIRRIRPGLIILMELEIWPNLLYEASRHDAEVIIVNGRISHRSFRGYRFMRSVLPELDRISLFSVQNEEYRRRLLDLDVAEDRVVISGNIKFDGIDTAEDRGGSEEDEDHRMRRELCFGAKARILVAGSTHHGEDDLLLQAYPVLARQHPTFRLILAPRHLERVAEIEKACLKNGLRPCRRTHLNSRRDAIGGGEVLILDTIGELERVYSLADVVFVGGSLVEVGGHNMLEPAGKGKAVVYGPHVFNFAEEASLLEGCGAAVRVPDVEALTSTVHGFLEDANAATRLGQRAQKAVAAAKGAAKLNVDLIRRHFQDTVTDLFGRQRGK